MRVTTPTPWQQMLLDRTGLEALAPYDKIYIVEQDNGYEPVVVLHWDTDVLIYQRGAQPVRVIRERALMLARDLRALSGTVESCTVENGYTIMVQGTQEGNAGDWALKMMSPMSYSKFLKGSRNLPELADALQGL